MKGYYLSERLELAKGQYQIFRVLIIRYRGLSHPRHGHYITTRLRTGTWHFRCSVHYVPLPPYKRPRLKISYRFAPQLELFD